MPVKTVAERDAEIAALKRERDVATLDGAKAVKAALVAGKVATLSEDLEALLPMISTDSATHLQARNIISVVRNGRNLIEGEIARIEALVAAQDAAGA